jgi:dinuclear metal center YbgI/SA1388 family protein
MPTVADLMIHLESLAPAELAADWDNVGLLLGDPAAPVGSVMTCLTLTPEVAEEAIAENVSLVVTHHPILFRSVKRLTTATSEGRMILALARAGTAVFSPHTAFDNAAGGINDALARKLGLVDVAPLRSRGGARQCKIVVFVPDSDMTCVSDALFAAGAGHIGQYSECSFRLAGMGTFFGSESTNPTVGQKGRREEVREWRLEAICPEDSVPAVVAAVRRAHSYEEPAFDVYPLQAQASSLGEGRVGRLARPMSLAELAQTAKLALNAGRVQMVGQHDKRIERVAIVCGAGGEFLGDAVRAKADVFLTGEMRFHDYLAAQAQGIALVLPGHYATERCGLEELAERMQAQWPDLAIWASRRERDPVDWL